MTDEEKSKQQLIAELITLRKRMHALEDSQAVCHAPRESQPTNGHADEPPAMAPAELIWNLEDLNLPVLDGLTEYYEDPRFVYFRSGPMRIAAPPEFLSRDVTETGSYDLTWITMASFGKLLDAIPIPILLVEGTGSIQFANTSFVKLSDDPAAVLSGDLFTLFPDLHEARRARDMLHEALNLRRPQTREGVLLVAEKEIWSRMHLRPMRFGTERSALVLIEDLTPERRELKLNEKYKKLVHIFPIGIGEFSFPGLVMCSAPGDEPIDLLLSSTLTDGNVQFALLNGYSDVEELRGRSFGKILPAGVHSLQLYRSWVESGFSVSCFETREKSAVGEFRYYENTLVGNVQDGCLAQFWAMKQDITERKRVEQELVEKIRTIDELYEHIIQSGKAKAIAEHTATVAHELRQPLAIIGGFARRMAGAGAGEPGSNLGVPGEGVQIIIKEVQRLEKILDGLIDFTRHDTLALQTVNPNDLIEYVLKINEAGFKEKNLILQKELGQEVGEIPLDPDRFQQVVRNLLANAIDASDPGGILRVETGVSIPSEMAHRTGNLTDESYFEIKILNRGKRIAKEHLEKIFNPFFTTKGYGTGLGLTLSKKIVEDHNGSISVQSDQEGTLLTVWLPLMSGSR